MNKTIKKNKLDFKHFQLAMIVVIFASLHSIQALAVLNLDELDGDNGFVINGVEASTVSQKFVSSAGDINGDGYDDLVIGGALAEANGRLNAGKTYIIFGGESDSSSASFNVSTLDGSNGFVINGEEAFDWSGHAVSSAGDFNSDGIDDLIIGAPRAGDNISGYSYVIFGDSNGFPPVLELSNLNGTNGFVIKGNDLLFNIGDYVNKAGDVNGDGVDDIIIGANGAGPNGDSSGSSYVVFGSNMGFLSVLNLSSLNGTNGFVINGVSEGDLSGASVSTAGDVNGDGIDDLLIGANGADSNGDNSGSSYVVFGNNMGFASTLEISDLNGSNGFMISGVSEGDLSGASVSTAGDVNGDGIDDLLIGAYGASPNGDFSGSSYVVFGSNMGFLSTFELSSVNGTNGFVINGANQEDLFGSNVSTAGDFNGDGINDLIFGAPKADPNGVDNAGSTYLLYGKSGAFSSPLTLSSLSGSDGLIINGTELESDTGKIVSSAGDVNNDGFDDVVIGSISDNGFDVVSQSFVVYGSDGFLEDLIFKNDFESANN